jgi:cytoskeletal protein RodZ
MANTKFNLSKGEDKKGFNLSKHEESKVSKFNPSKEQNPSTSSSSNGKKSKWWLWLLLAVVLIGIVFFVLKQCSATKDSTGDATVAPIEQITPAEQNPASESVSNETKPAEETSVSKTPETVSEKQENVPVQSSTPQETVPAESATKPAATQKPATQSAQQSHSTVSGDVERLADEVIKGRYGNGADRRQQLGDRYSEIQRRVNEKYRNGEIVY